MMGLAGTITPTNTGNVQITITGSITNGTGGDGANVQMRYGTSTAPTNGAAATGTALGTAVNFTNGAAITQTVPFSLTAYATGLTPSTAYWLDLGLQATTGGTASYVVTAFGSDY